MNGLLNFDPWAYQPPATRTQQIYKASLDQFFGNRKKGTGPGDPSQNILTTQPLAALGANYARMSNNMMSRNVASGDAGLTNSGLLDARANQLRDEAEQQHAFDASNVVSGAQNQALGGFQQAKNDQRSFGLQAAGIKANALAAGNPKNYVMPPTGYSGGGGGALLGGLGGFLLAGPAGAQIGSQIGGSFNKTLAPGSQGGQQQAQGGFPGLAGGLGKKIGGWGGLLNRQPASSRAGSGYGGFGDSAWAT